MKDKKEKANKACFEQKDRGQTRDETLPLQRGKKIDNTISHQQLTTYSLHSLWGYMEPSIPLILLLLLPILLPLFLPVYHMVYDKKTY